MEPLKFPNVFFELRGKNRKRLYTKNLVPGLKVYEEELLKKNGIEYRYWDPKRSKLAAAIFTGSGAMMAESIHSFADCGNQVLLLVGIPLAGKLVREEKEPPASAAAAVSLT